MLLKLLSLFALVLCSCQSSEKNAKKEAKVIPVIVRTPDVQDVPLYIESIGILSPSMQGEIFSQVHGELKEILATEGQMVSPGTPLAKIDVANYTLNLQEAEGMKASSQATLLAAEKKLVRLHHLLEKDLISQNEWDMHEMEVEKAKAALAIAEIRRKQAELECSRCTLSSPISGRVGKIDLHHGMWIDKSQKSLMSIANLDPLFVEFTVTEKEVPSLLENNGKIEIESLISDEIRKDARITFLDNQFDPKTGLILVRGLVSNPEMDLKPGQSVRVRISWGSLSRQILIPQKAIRYNDQGPYVYLVLPDETAVQRQVKMGREVGKMVVITEGLEPTETVITEGHLRLSRGAKVSIQEL